MPEAAEVKASPVFEEVAADDAAMPEIAAEVAVAISAEMLVVAVSAESFVIAVYAGAAVVAIAAEILVAAITVAVSVVEAAVAVLIVRRVALRSMLHAAELRSPHGAVVARTDTATAAEARRPGGSMGHRRARTAAAAHMCTAVEAGSATAAADSGSAAGAEAAAAVMALRVSAAAEDERYGCCQDEFLHSLTPLICRESVSLFSYGNVAGGDALRGRTCYMSQLRNGTARGRCFTCGSTGQRNRSEWSGVLPAAAIVRPILSPPHPSKALRSQRGALLDNVVKPSSDCAALSHAWHAAGRRGPVGRPVRNLQRGVLVVASRRHA